MIKSQAAANRAELEMRRLNTKAKAYYSGTDGFIVYETEGKYLIEFENTGDKDKEFNSFNELEEYFTELYEDYVANVIADEFDELYQGWNDDSSVRAEQAGERYHKGEKIVKLYNELFPDDWAEDTILKDHENGYLSINDGKDGNEYAYYLDENNCAVVNLATGEIDKDAIFIEENF